MDTEIESSYQDTQKQQERHAAPPSFATIAGLYDDGASLIFDGETEPSEKHYRANLYCKFEVGQRVYIAKDNGTYVILFPVGVPNSKTISVDSTKTAESASSADKATSATSAAKLSSSRKISLGGALSGSTTFDGSSDVTINASISSTATVGTATNFTGRHMGTSIGFFKSAAYTKQSVKKMTTTATADNLKTKLNELIGALNKYGLV